MQTMYPGIVNSPVTELADAIDATATTIEVVDGSKLPNAPNLATIGTGEDAETILYTQKTGNILSGVTRGFQGTAKAWPAGAKVARMFTEYDHSAFLQNIQELDTTVGNHIGNTVIHVSQSEKDAWNAKETPAGAQTKANQAETNAKIYTDTVFNQLNQKIDEHKAEIASPTQLGHIKVGQGLEIEPDGTLNSTGGMYAEGVIKGPTGNAIGAYTFADSATYVSRITARNDAAKTVTVVDTTGLSVGDQVVLKTNNSSNLPTATVIAISNNVVTLNTASTLDASITHLIKLSGSNIRQTAEGFNTIASGSNSHAEGFSTIASGSTSHAEGFSTIASGSASHAEGYFTTASGNYSHAEGALTIASGNYSHAEGSSTTASGNYSHAEGSSTTASGNYSHAEGAFTIASGNYSHAEGTFTIANVYASHAGGHYNRSMTGSPTSMVATADAYVIGNGTSDAARGNAFRVTFDGKVYGLSAFNSTGADYAEFFEWLDGNPENEDRVGYFVTLEGNKIRKATSTDDYILGIVTANPSVVGDSHQDDWHGKYVRDVWGRIQYQWVDVPAEYDDQGNEVSPARRDYVPILNPDWNPDEEYIPREKRKEWASVGIIGKLLVRDDGTCVVNGYCRPNDDGIATASSDGYRVMERVSENVVRVFIK